MKGDFVCQENFVENFVAAKDGFDDGTVPFLENYLLFS